jgi:hypothetical protein
MSSASQSRALRRVVRDRHTNERGRLPPMGWPGRAPTIGDVESDRNQHRSAVDPCQSNPDDSSVYLVVSNSNFNGNIPDGGRHPVSENEV